MIETEAANGDEKAQQLVREADCDWLWQVHATRLG